MATHCSILAWKIPWQRSLAGYSPWDHKELDTPERLTHTHMPCTFSSISDIFLKPCIYEFCCCLCSIAKSSLTLCDSMDCSTPGFPVFHYLPEFVPTHVHWISDAIQPSHSLSPASPPALNLSEHHGLFQWVGFLHQVAKAFLHIYLYIYV